jgi:CHAD domain-containing protein
VPLPDHAGWVPLEQVIAANLSVLFAQATEPACSFFRVTRGAKDDPWADQAGNEDTDLSPVMLTRHSPAAEVVLAYLRDQVAAISRYDPLVRRDEPDAVHQMRVATRRARSALQAFGTIIDREAVVSFSSSASGQLHRRRSCHRLHPRGLHLTGRLAPAK